MTNALVWHDSRTESIVNEFLASKFDNKATKYSHITGCPINTYFSACKMLWMIRNVPAVESAFAENRLQFGTIDSWLLHKLCGV